MYTQKVKIGLCRAPSPHGLKGRQHELLLLYGDVGHIQARMSNRLSAALSVCACSH